MPNSRLKIMEDEFLTSIDYYDEFHVNLLFDRSIFRPMCTHMGKDEKSHTHFPFQIFYSALRVRPNSMLLKYFSDLVKDIYFELQAARAEMKDGSANK